MTGEPQLPLEVLDLLTWLRVERGRSANTLAAYRRDLIAYVQWLRQRSVSIADVSEPDVNAYIGYLRESGRAPSSQKRALVAVRSLHRFLAEEHEGRPDPAAEVEVPRVPRGLPKALTEAEVESLLASVDGTDAVARRDRAILELLYGTGLRISELVGVSLSDIDIDAGLLRAFGKGSKERVVPLGRYCVVALVDWLGASGRAELIPDQWARRSDSDAVFLNRRGGRLSRQGAWMVVKRAGDKVGLGHRLSPHVLRHSCATHMVDHGADIRTVQELLGHASISTTQVYTMVSTERLWSVYRQAHPRARADT
ncbi:MAG: site-specific tyrosine recombinase XerD [Acidimicrobiales bacterium]